MFHRAQKGWTWRAIVASAAAYALALNLILAGALSGQIALAGAASVGFEICLAHGGNADQQSPALPDAGKLHCALCVVATHAPVVPEGAVGVAAAFAASTTIAVERTHEASPSLAPRDPGKPPTGPPHAV
jgi:hypothetical protein